MTTTSTSPKESTLSAANVPLSRKRPRPTTALSSSSLSPEGGSITNDHHDNEATSSAKPPHGAPHDDIDHSRLLSPHTLRLLKLIQEGTTEHAQRAIVLLTRQCSASSFSSPTMLWNIVGRLQALLTVSEWSTRIHASWAMQQVARYLPMHDQIQFLLQAPPPPPPAATVVATTTEEEGTIHREEQKPAPPAQQQPLPRDLWLTVDDLTNRSSISAAASVPPPASSNDKKEDGGYYYCTGLEQVLYHGRPLVASTGHIYDNDHQTYQREEAWLQTMDSSHNSIKNVDDDYRLRRMRFQRKILAQRLGLAGIVQAVQRQPSSRKQKRDDGNHHHVEDHKDDDDMLPCLTVDDAYDDLPTQTTTTGFPVNDVHDDKGDDSNLPNAPFRALLLLEMKQQQQQSSSSSSSPSCFSHSNPQQLLATELVYRMFDPAWQVRHGAVLGLLALVRAWHKTATTTTTSTTTTTTGMDGDESCHHHHSGSLFGQWPHDILTKGIALLALDRFGDYSATAMDAVVYTTTASGSSSRHDHSSSGSRSVVAPVREIAGQLVSMLWSMAPKPIQQATISLLLHLSKYALEWEVRHAGLVGLKYLVVSIRLELQRHNCIRRDHDGVAAAVASVTESKSCHHHDVDVGENNEGRWYRQCLDTIAEIAIERLGDSMEDVQSVAAHILTQLLQDHARENSVHNKNNATNDHSTTTLMRNIAAPLWSALQQPIHSMSACVVDLVQLFSWVLSQNCSLVLDALVQADHHTTTATDNGSFLGKTLETILNKWMEFLTQLDIPSVQVAAIEAIGNIAEPVSDYLSHSTSDALVQVYCRLLGRIFESYFDARLLLAGTEHEQDTEMLLLVQTRDRTWSRLVQAGASAGDLTKEHWVHCCETLLYRYFGIHQNQDSNNDSTSLDHRAVPFSPISYNFRQMVDAANALAAFLQMHVGKVPHGLIDLIEFALIAFFVSPWTSKCESACLLYIALMRSTGNQSHRTLQMPNFHKEAVSMLSMSPLCLVASDLDPTNEVLGKLPILQSCNNTFMAIWARLGRHNCDLLQSTTTVKTFWLETFKSHGLDLHKEDLTAERPVTSASMRLSTTIVGVVIAGGRRSLPTKLTPVIRPLMTSIKNETKGDRLDETCRYLNELIQHLTSQGWKTMPTDSPFLRTAEKILSNLCDLAWRDPESNAGSKVGASRVITSLVETLPDHLPFESITPLWCRLVTLQHYGDSKVSDSNIDGALQLLRIVCLGFAKNPRVAFLCVQIFLSPLIAIACMDDRSLVRKDATLVIERMCAVVPQESLTIAFKAMMPYLRQHENNSHRIYACELMNSILQEVGLAACSFVRNLLPISMTLMTDSEERCAWIAARIFATLVRLAPLVEKKTSVGTSGQGDAVIDHLIHGFPLPPCLLPDKVKVAFERSGLTLRSYQEEGVSWLAFLQNTNLNGALCDSMGLGKTIMALLAVSISHDGTPTSRSLVVCPSSVVGHWASEVEKTFPGKSIFRTTCLLGASRQRKALWVTMSKDTNLVITSYSVLRSDAEVLAKVHWNYCILDEGHLLKNPKTATARASRLLRSSHKLILTGTPVQNRVSELWATFDFLMPNFLGSSVSFNKEFAKPIGKGQLPGASAECIHQSLEKLKLLHQQVLPFILRREKEHVLKELPPKCITNIPCRLSAEQHALYSKISELPVVKQSIQTLEQTLGDVDFAKTTAQISLGPATLKSLMLLRLLCTHPNLVKSTTLNGSRLEASGKFLALNDLLRSAGVYKDEITAADNDFSVLYCDNDDGASSDGFADVLTFDGDVCIAQEGSSLKPSKALIFAQFTKSLDAVEEYLFRPHMPSLRYLRLDGRVPAEERAKLADTFNRDDSIRAMLLTTKIGGLGLNLTGADVVIFLEHDWNPHADLQAMDRAHRIGQTRAVNVYRLVASNSIEEKVMKLQETKLATAAAIVNTDNSTMYTMGTDRLLDIFTFRSNDESSKGNLNIETLEAFVDRFQEDYASLSMETFLEGLGISTTLMSTLD